MAIRSGRTPRCRRASTEHAGRRAKLVDALARLALDPASPIRDKLQACRLLAVSMTAANLQMLDHSIPSGRKARQGRMGTNLQGERGPPCGPTVRSETSGPAGPGRPDPTDRLEAGRVVSWGLSIGDRSRPRAQEGHRSFPRSSGRLRFGTWWQGKTVGNGGGSDGSLPIPDASERGVFR
jgi:hypothetical protein